MRDFLYRLELIFRKSTGSARRTAVHEAGHALVSVFSNSMSLPDSISIIPNERRTGRTTFSIPDNFEDIPFEAMNGALSSLFGGIEAERAVYGSYRIGGASGDIDKARRMSEILSLFSYANGTSAEDLFETARRNAELIIHGRRDQLDILATALLKSGQLDRSQIFRLLRVEEPLPLLDVF